jgi:branched-chain amino acid transport system ATP-binding protein
VRTLRRRRRSGPGDTGPQCPPAAATHRGGADAADEGVGAATLLQVRGLTRRFGGLVALDRLDLEVEAGRLLVVMGPNGAGKSTLVDLLTGYLRPSCGAFYLAGVELSSAPRWKLARFGITRTFQVPRPLGRFSVFDNLRIAARRGTPPWPGRDEAERQAGSLLALTGLEDDARRYPSELTLAALRRLELARALAGRPRLLIADEPLGGLSGPDVDAGIELLRRLATPDRAVLVVEHSVRAVLEVADELAFLHHGRLLRRGPAAEVLADRAVAEAYLGAGLLRRGLF